MDSLRTVGIPMGLGIVGTEIKPTMNGNMDHHRTTGIQTDQLITCGATLIRVEMDNIRMAGMPMVLVMTGKAITPTILGSMDHHRTTGIPTDQLIPGKATPTRGKMDHHKSVGILASDEMGNQIADGTPMALVITGTINQAGN